MCEKLCRSAIISEDRLLAALDLNGNILWSIRVNAFRWTWFDEMEETTLVSDTPAYFRHAIYCDDKKTASP